MDGVREGGREGDRVKERRVAEREGGGCFESLSGVCCVPGDPSHSQHGASVPWPSRRGHRQHPTAETTGTDTPPTGHPHNQQDNQLQAVLCPIPAGAQ